MNKMREVAELLGLEWIDEENRSENFQVDYCDKTLMFITAGLHSIDEDGHIKLEINAMHGLLTGIITIKKPKWKPKNNLGI